MFASMMNDSTSSIEITFGIAGNKSAIDRKAMQQAAHTAMAQICFMAKTPSETNPSAVVDG